MKTEVKQNKYGYFELKDKPSPEELKEYYNKKYYQESKGQYARHYSERDIQFINSRFDRKHNILKKHFSALNGKKFLDVGCGEGWALKYFSEKGLDVKGIDYSKEGCQSINPQMLKYFSEGSVEKLLYRMSEENQKFDIIMMDNVLEHILQPRDILHLITTILERNGLLIIEVPNDFSTLQHYLLEHDKIKDQFWVVNPDHISYFNQEGLKNLCHDCQLNQVESTTDYPIDIHLLNEDSNYNRDKSKGKNVHHARVDFELLLNAISVDKANHFYAALAELGLGRNIISYFKKAHEVF